ncbi:response regulator [Leptolyngbyaceae cyanobacterium CCMR0082]|uniref:Response regulator n=2 Tax=Adonisia turfae TaxID=2950184 RepID=A0A6M0RZS7_9CYAN|nr:response regulator [Adonisia turfae]MDV3349310.1 response regulator [Leptothoe sp. LEGE 181152]NEZ57970.1 response regulator [Adonisia turfae CCMR0081]NEZ61470.1 response regulator [Adonisia turfae CCMR0082]
MEITELTQLLKLPNTNLDGYLIFSNQQLSWKLTVIQGQLLYAVDNTHVVRRWNRNFEKYCPNVSWANTEIHPSTDEPWQMQWLDFGVSQKHLSLIRAKLMIRAIIQECLFELSLCKFLQHHWQPSKLSLSQVSRSLALSTWETKMTHRTVQNLRQQWQATGLMGLNPSLSPVLKTFVEPQILQLPQQYFTGRNTLWDIAVKLDKSIVEVTQHLLPLIKNQALELRTIPDLPLSKAKLSISQSSKTSTRSTTSSVSRKSRTFSASTISAKLEKPVSSFIESAPAPQATDDQPLIACIDDSPVLAHSLKKILATAGYRTLIIQEPMQGFSQLIEHVPRLILLDVMLPNADGYNICRFLRDTPTFKNTPIIILTGRSRPVDRARASMAGATEFLVKPPEPNELLSMIRKYLQPLSN